MPTTHKPTWEFEESRQPELDAHGQTEKVGQNEHAPSMAVEETLRREAWEREQQAGRELEAALHEERSARAGLERALRREHELFEWIFDTVPILMTIYDPNTRVLRVNHAFEKLIGWSNEDLGTVSMMEKCYPDPEYRERAQVFMQACEPEWRDFRIATRAGTVIESSWTNVRLSDAKQLGIGVDVTARQQMTERLRRNEERLQLAAIAAHGAMWDLDVERQRFWWSAALGPVYGHSNVDAEDKLAWLSLVHPEDRERVLAHGAAILASRVDPEPIEYRFRRGDGSYANVLDRSLVLRDESGKATRVIGNMADITAIRQAEAALRESEEALRQADHRKDEFLATLAHELRNPLAPMRNAVEILRASALAGPMAQGALATLDRQLGVMVRLVDDLLDVSRIRTGKMDLTSERVELQSVVHHAISSTQPLFRNKRHRLVIDEEPRALIVEGDPLRLEQVVTNLLHNAAKFTPEGGRISVTLERNATHAVLRVCDTGIGIPPQVLSSIFDLFVQADTSVERSHAGLGIGLSLVKRLVEMHGGRVSAVSAGPGQGSEFQVRLPLLAVRAPAREPGTPGEPLDSAPNVGGQCTVLVVDDNVDAADTTALVLSNWGHEVLVAHSGRAALEIGRARRVDVVVMDLGMPVMSGYTAAREMRADPRFNGVVLVALTGWGQTEARRESKSAGFDHHLIKPADLAILRSIVSTARRSFLEQ